MPDQKTGSFSDLYEVMRERKTAPSSPRAARPSRNAAVRPVEPPVLEDKSREVGKEGSRETGKEIHHPSTSGTEPVPVDLNVRPYRKDSFMFTDAEFHALEQLKLDLRSKHDLPATKNDLARCAISFIIDDYRRFGASSTLVTTLRRKSPR